MKDVSFPLNPWIYTNNKALLSDRGGSAGGTGVVGRATGAGVNVSSSGDADIVWIESVEAVVFEGGLSIAADMGWRRGRSQEIEDRRQRCLAEISAGPTKWLSTLPIMVAILAIKVKTTTLLAQIVASLKDDGNGFETLGCMERHFASLPLLDWGEFAR